MYWFRPWAVLTNAAFTGWLNSSTKVGRVEMFRSTPCLGEALTRVSKDTLFSFPMLLTYLPDIIYYLTPSRRDVKVLSAVIELSVPPLRASPLAETGPRLLV